MKTKKQKVVKKKGIANPYPAPKERKPSIIVHLIGNRILRAVQDEMRKLDDEMSQS